jgi:hypothetical protein
VSVERISDRTVDEWLAEFERLRALDAKLRGDPRAKRRSFKAS